MDRGRIDGKAKERRVVNGANAETRRQQTTRSQLFPTARALFLSPFHSRRILLLLLLVRDVRTHRMQFNISAAARFVHVDAPLCIPPTRPHSFTLMHHNLRCICRGAQRNAARRICGPSFITVSPSSRCTNIFEAIKKKNIHDEYRYFLSFFNVTYFQILCSYAL